MPRFLSDDSLLLLIALGFPQWAALIEVSPCDE